MSKSDMSALKRARMEAVTSTAGKGGAHGGIMSLKGKGAAMCGHTPPANNMSGLKKNKFKG